MAWDSFNRYAELRRKIQRMRLLSFGINTRIQAISVAERSGSDTVTNRSHADLISLLADIESLRRLASELADTFPPPVMPA